MDEFVEAPPAPPPAAADEDFFAAAPAPPAPALPARCSARALAARLSQPCGEEL